MLLLLLPFNFFDVDRDGGDDRALGDEEEEVVVVVVVVVMAVGVQCHKAEKTSRKPKCEVDGPAAVCQNWFMWLFFFADTFFILQ